MRRKLTADEQDKLAVRNVLFETSTGKSLDAVMQGSIMAQVKIVAAHTDSQELAEDVLRYYYEIALSAVPAYRSELSGEA